MIFFRKKREERPSWIEEEIKKLDVAASNLTGEWSDLCSERDKVKREKLYFFHIRKKKSRDYNLFELNRDINVLSLKIAKLHDTIGELYRGKYKTLEEYANRSNK